MHSKFSIIALVLLLISCSKDNSTKVEYQAYSCIESQSICQKEIGEGKVDIKFNVAEIKPESEVTLKLVQQLNKPVKKISGFIEGKSMYMGKIPLIFDSVSTEKAVEAQFMLGSCSDPNMTWRTWIEIKFEDDSKSNFFFDFASNNT